MNPRLRLNAQVFEAVLRRGFGNLGPRFPDQALGADLLVCGINTAS
jgi:hypothetical protein